jgi:ATP-binding cassette subfamily B multidrug efflux pump
MPKKTAKEPQNWKRIWQMIRPYRGWMIASMVLAAFTVAFTLYIPILVGNAIDAMVEAGKVSFAIITPILWKIAILAVLTALFQWVMQTMHNKITYQVVRDFRTAAFEKIQKLPLSYLDRHPTGKTVSRVITDVDQFADGLLMGFTQLFTGVFTLIGTLLFMLVLDWKISLVVILMTPLSILFAKSLSGHIYKMFRAQSEARAEQTAMVNEAIGNQKVIQAFHHEEATMEQFQENNKKLQETSLRASFFSSLINPGTRFIYAVVYAAVGLIGALSVLSGRITVGGLSCFLNYTNQYTKPFNEITGVLTELQNAVACANRLFNLLDEPEETPDAPDAVDRKTVDGNVTIQDVDFSYVPEKPLIEHLNLQAKSGQRIAIVGPTGCGKTTLINLLMRFYEVNSGAILIDGVETKHMTRHSLRQNFGMVLQETWLKSGTIRENICMGKPDATEEEMILAAKAAHAHTFIQQLPQGYDTEIRDGGNLSQGQKQLLCIARVMLCLPPMLILDEATSSIDTRTEVRIQEAFATMMKGRTSFIVAHRLSTIREADVILVMKDGHIIEQGNHETLLEKNGFYAKLYRSQFVQTAS